MKKLTKETIERTWEIIDDNRLFCDGGYPSQMTIDKKSEIIYIATVDHDGGPELLEFSQNNFLEYISEFFAEVMGDEELQNAGTNEFDYFNNKYGGKS